MSDQEKLRLSKLMSERGICSRREADRLIEQGLVKVNGEIVNQLGLKVGPEAKVEVVQEGQRQLDQKVTIIVNKPIGFVSSQPEDGYRSAVELITPENTEEKAPLKNNHFRGLGPAGRLD